MLLSCELKSRLKLDASKGVFLMKLKTREILLFLTAVNFMEVGFISYEPYNSVELENKIKYRSW